MFRDYSKGAHSLYCRYQTVQSLLQSSLENGAIVPIPLPVIISLLHKKRDILLYSACIIGCIIQPLFFFCSLYMNETVNMQCDDDGDS